MKTIVTSTAASSMLAALAIAQLVLPAMTALAAGGPVSAHRHDNDRVTKVFTLDPSTHGNPEGVAFDPDSGAFFVSATGDGTIYRGTLDNSTVTEFIPGAPGKEAAGMKVAQGKLYVAGAFTGAVRVYEIATKQLVASFETGGDGMLNDLVVTKEGDVFVTDSFRPTLWRITAEQVAAGAGTPEGIPVDPEIKYTVSPDPFNLNGIVALNSGRRLIVVQSNTGKLFRIDFNDHASNGREIHEIAVDEPLFGDGLLLDRGQLIVVTFAPAFTLTFVKLDDRAERGKVVERRTDPTLREPSTVAKARYLYLVVNADFGTSTIPFTVTGLPRNDDDEDQ
jgi:sugar lactone lactonase YvrE